MLGLPLASMIGMPGLMSFIGRQDIGSVANVDFAWTQDFDDVVFRLSSIVPATNDDELLIRTSSDGGSSFDAGASDYESYSAIAGVGSYQPDSFNNVNYMRIAGDGVANWGVANSAGIGFTGTAVLEQPFATDRFTRLHVLGGLRNGGAFSSTMLCAGARLTAGRVDAVRFLWFSGGNFASGSIEAWGLLPVERAA